MVCENLDYLRVMEVADGSLAVALGTGRAQMPKSWARLLDEPDNTDGTPGKGGEWEKHRQENYDFGPP